MALTFDGGTTTNGYDYEYGWTISADMERLREAFETLGRTGDEVTVAFRKFAESLNGTGNLCDVSEAEAETALPRRAIAVGKIRA